MPYAIVVAAALNGMDDIPSPIVIPAEDTIPFVNVCTGVKVLAVSVLATFVIAPVAPFTEVTNCEESKNDRFPAVLPTKNFLSDRLTANSPAVSEGEAAGVSVRYIRMVLSLAISKVSRLSSEGSEGSAVDAHDQGRYRIASSSRIDGGCRFRLQIGEQLELAIRSIAEKTAVLGNTTCELAVET